MPPGNEARCLKCKAVLRTPTGTTTTLASHLKRHPDIYQSYQDELQVAKRSAQVKDVNKVRPCVQPLVAESFRPRMHASAPKAKAMTKLVAQFITRGMHLYRIVEEPGFLNMMNFTRPDYTLTTFSRVIVPELYRAKKAEVKSNLAKVIEREVEAISLTTDSWTSRANDSYVCVTCHVMDKEFVQHVACAEMAECHTAENLQRFTESVLEESEIPAQGQVPIYVVTDNSRSFVLALARST
ncbi:hypothetical protein HPB48_009799 [Haemaphysalis longicornis]|uniref:BED-type domain-containing protein n=1 Tax=Haemaphysalis longicornis TaxID=44386 RepID=A0A9J6H447_HAELO|nr:hypothetical protein HPB48_009799 [Haemaphysalis longicornis]